MKSWLSALARTRVLIRDSVSRLMGEGARPDAAALDACEEALIRADVPARLAADWTEAIRRGKGDGAVRDRLEAELLRALPAGAPFSWQLAQRPTVVLITGVNGSGKTTTAAKLAHRARREGLKPLLAATDTFRAAGAHQLRLWAERLGCDVVAGAQGADAAAVAYDAVRAAVSRGMDIVFVDTAGRMHTRQPLMDELQKVRRSIGKALPGAPHESWIVLDATLGGNAVAQARIFKEAVDLTGVVIAKLDGSSKAGFILAIGRELGLVVRFAGVGEDPDDLAPFDPAGFVRGLVGPDDGAK
jgi:fused signal recognition particle receptor